MVATVPPAIRAHKVRLDIRVKRAKMDKKAQLELKENKVQED
jgi:hypothetical protein